MGCCEGTPNWAESRPPVDRSNPNLSGYQLGQEAKISARQFVRKLVDPITTQYRFKKEIGTGSFGRVVLAEQISTGQLRAVKEITKPRTKSDPSQSKFICEVEILSKLDHPNILKVLELYETDDKYYIVTELLTGGELFDYFSKSKQLSEPVAGHIMFQILSAVRYCHANNIVHRDLKPENLLLAKPPKGIDDITIKIIDFGTSTLLSPDSSLHQRIGTAYYIAPEVLDMQYNEKCDVWSCGVILYIILGGYPPFAGKTNVDILNKVRIGDFNFNHDNWNSVSSEAKELIAKMMTRDTRLRPSAEECLNHPWIQKYRTAPAPSALVKSLTNLRSFYVANKLRRTIVAFIASQLLTSEHTSQLAAAFAALDSNCDGKLSREEMLVGYSTIMPRSEAEEVVTQVLQAADLDGSGFIDFSEFIAGSSAPGVLLSKNKLQQAFKNLDRDNSGKITMAELRAGLGLEDSPAIWQELVGEADQNGDGEIDAEEFTRLMLKASSD